MAGADYLKCTECHCKIVYDGSWNGRERIEEIWGEDCEILCPDCIKKLKESKETK